ncbi:MAG TPA: fumarylacetoacetate hydrolase family protein [Pirellulales bacterium]|jgi:2-dehydro-3-deoxy-D-arabinonate dehydratase|nr:fumarylacetoacetate hydrolase family protein [Pirellulales bacterium]
MKLVKYAPRGGQDSIGLLEGEEVLPLSSTGDQYRTLTDILEADDPAALVELLFDQGGERVPLHAVTLLPPVDRQEIWAAGVTYTRSRKARMEESVGAAAFYDKVYEAPRPELFFKANAHRVVGPDRPVRIRHDANWNVPEPELTLVLNSRMKLVGYTIGNDMSSRDIEGENPLYLPQAKVYDQSCALGPCIALVNAMPPREQIGIHMAVIREHAIAFEGSTDVGQMARTFEDLIDYLGRDNTFRHGACLLTGTGIVPGDDFTLRRGDIINITIDGIGTLVNSVVQG